MNHPRPFIDPAMLERILPTTENEMTFEERREIETALANPIFGFIDKMWTDFEADQRARYPDVYALGEKLARERDELEQGDGE